MSDMLSFPDTSVFQSPALFRIHDGAKWQSQQGRRTTVASLIQNPCLNPKSASKCPHCLTCVVDHNAMLLSKLSKRMLLRASQALHVSQLSNAYPLHKPSRRTASHAWPTPNNPVSGTLLCTLPKTTSVTFSFVPRVLQPLIPITSVSKSTSPPVIAPS